MIRSLQPLIRRTASSAVPAEVAKYRDPFYVSADHLAWRKAVLERAGYRCEAIEHGARCGKAAPAHRLFADHRQEIQDGGARLSLANGQALCGKHHSIKTARERAARRLPQRKGRAV